MRIGIIGAGNVGGALGTGWARAGHEVIFGVRNPADDKVRGLLQSGGAGARAAGVAEAVAAAEVIALATPWAAARDALASAGDFAGRILVDCTNPIGRDLLPATEAGTSAGEQVAGWAPGARVVKAFNTTGYNIMQASSLSGRAAAMFLCGDDETARRTVAGLAGDLGFEPVDCGPLRNARLLEAMASLWVWLAMNGKEGWGREFAFGILRR